MVQEWILLAKNQNFVLSNLFNFYTGFDSNHALAKDCDISECLLTKNWIFLYDDKLLRQDVIPDGKQLTLYCNRQTEELHLKCNNGILEDIPRDKHCTNPIFEKAVRGPGLLFYVVHQGHMVNVQDFITKDQKDATMLNINIVPMFAKCNLGNWKKVENWINKKAGGDTRNSGATNNYALIPDNVVTGTFDVLQLADQNKKLVPIYLMPRQKNPVPMWLYKVVKFDGKCHVFLVLNNPTQVEPAGRANLCKPVQCPDGLSYSADSNDCLSYCCDYQSFVGRVGAHARLC
ncbi:uncharacterized protein [Musca autumnalis]|uniref:uncharacterized protein n=1 Tax=Musca autumnalis TaxID=221902 RepID=UPI003CEF1A80